MQMIGPFRKELRCRTNERCGRRSLKYVDGRKATNAAAARGQSLPLPRSGLVQQNLSVIRIRGRGLKNGLITVWAIYRASAKIARMPVPRRLRRTPAARFSARDRRIVPILLQYCRQYIFSPGCELFWIR